MNEDTQQDSNKNKKKSNVLVLLNCVTENELQNMDEITYEDIIDDIACECEKWGNLLQVCYFFCFFCVRVV